MNSFQRMLANQTRLRHSLVRVSAWISLLFMLAACGDDSITLQAQFDNPSSVVKGTPVLFNNEQIGEAVQVEQQGSGYQVTMSLQPEALQMIGKDSAVLINSLKQDSPLELYNRSAEPQEFIEDGQAIRGLNSLLDLGAWMVGGALEIGTNTANEYIESFQSYLDSEEFQQDKEAFQEQYQSARNEVGTVLSELQSALETSAQQIEANEQAAAEAIKQLGEELQPMMKDLAKNSVQIAEELEQFSQSLANSSPEERQAGEAFLISLLETLQQLNEAIEEGAAVESD